MENINSEIKTENPSGEKISLLDQAFKEFNLTSFRLEQYYQELEKKVIDLRRELDRKNRLLEELTEERERNNRLTAMGEMAVNIAHEIRNPLGSIELFASILKKELSAEPEKQKLAGYISVGVKNLDRIVSNMLLFTRPLRPFYRKVDLTELVTEVVGFISPLSEQNNIFIEQLISPDLVRIKADPDLLKQALLNLVLNAVQANPVGGKVSLTAKKDITTSDWVVIEITDTGCGIIPENLKKIFNPFFTTKEKGTGLGLAIVHNIINVHRGKIEVESKPEQGTTFKIGLPSNEK